MNRSDHKVRRRGVTAVEFAIIAPVLLLLMLATADTVLWLRAWFRVEQTTAELAQIATQYTTLYDSDFTATLFPIAQTISGSIPVGCNNGATIITGMSNASGTPVIAWQRLSGSCGFSSRFGVLNHAPTLPGGYAMPTGSALIGVELFTKQIAFVFSAHLLSGSGLSTIQVYHISAPRGGALPSIIVGNRP